MLLRPFSFLKMIGFILPEHEKMSLTLHRKLNLDQLDMKTMFYMLLTAVLLSVSSIAKAQDIPNDEGVIVVDITQNTTETGPKRAPAIIPISANYYLLSSCLEVLFLYDMGDVTVSVTNLNTGYNSTFMTDSSHGIILPLLRIPGPWEITFNAEGKGVIYIGRFIVP